jgi:glycosyltransferase involved in cell wall biosynthesis
MSAVEKMNRRPAALRICVYYPWLYLTSGCERTIIEIARRSRHTIHIVTNEYQPDATFPELKELDVEVLSRVPVKRTIGAVGLAAWRLLRQRLDVKRYDALLVVCEGLGDLVALRHPELPAFCLCMTPLRIAFDPEYRRNYLPTKPPAQRAAIRAGAWMFAVVDRIAWRRYRRIFPISWEIQRRIIRGRLATAERMQLLHPGVDLEAFTAAPWREKVFFVPGRIMWTKNLELAIDAFRLFRNRTGDNEWRLRIAGTVDRKSEPYLEKLRQHAAGDPKIEFCIRPSDDELRAMYRDCFLTLFTAFNEDWGLVMIEAMASGKPVVALNRGGPLEIVRHEVDGLLAEGTPSAFADAMSRLATDPVLYGRLAANAAVGAARFGWQPFIEALDEAIETSLRDAGESYGPVLVNA